MSYITNLRSKTITKPDLLGSKGAGLKRMSHRGLPVPRGFILTTKAWKLFDKNKNLPKMITTKIFKALKNLEKETGKTLGSPHRPLILSTRSGAKYSMPGMLDTILNVGVCEDVLPGLARMLGGEVFALDTYRRFIRLFASSVYGIHIGEFDAISGNGDPSKLDPASLRKLINTFKKFIFEKTGQEIPQEPKIQLRQAVTTVLDSWYNPGAIAFRQINGIPDDIGTAVTIQTMVFGNKKNSGSGVLFTRDTQTGDNQYTGDYLEMAQGEDLVRGMSARKAIKIREFAKQHPKLAKKLFTYAKHLEKLYRDIQDIEFTIENGHIWLLQSRTAQRSPLANIRFARDLSLEGSISREEALRRVKPSDIEHLSLPKFEKIEEEIAEKNKLFARGISASSGIAVGAVALSPRNVAALQKQRKQAIWVSDHIDPNDINTLMQVDAVVTSKGSASSHMALIMRSAGIPGIVGCSAIKVNKKKGFISNDLCKLKVGDRLSVNASLGNIYTGILKKQTSQKVPEDIVKFLKLRIDKLGRSPWSAALYTDKQAPSLTQLLKHIRQIHQKSKLTWKSQKAQIVDLVNRLFPKEEIIRCKLIKPDDIDSLRIALFDVLKAGYFNGPRTCHWPEKLANAPWTDGPNTPMQIERFLNDPNYPGKYGGYPKWRQDKTLNAVLVMEEHKGKLNPALAKKHIACTVSCLNTYPPSVVVTLNLGTPQLRSLERVESTTLIIIKATLNPKADYELGNITYQIGEEHFDETKLKELLDAMQASGRAHTRRYETLIRPARHLTKQIKILFPEVSVNTLNLSSLKKLLIELMTGNALPADVYQHIVAKQIISLLKQISNRIFEDWWRPPMALPYLMTVLDEELGLSVVEAQGRFEGDKLAWFKIYGTKGAEEKEKINNWKNKSFKNL